MSNCEIGGEVGLKYVLLEPFQTYSKLLRPRFHSIVRILKLWVSQFVRV